MDIMSFQSAEYSERSGADDSGSDDGDSGSPIRHSRRLARTQVVNYRIPRGNEGLREDMDTDVSEEKDNKKQEQIDLKPKPKPKDNIIYKEFSWSSTESESENGTKKKKGKGKDSGDDAKDTDFELDSDVAEKESSAEGSSDSSLESAVLFVPGRDDRVVYSRAKQKSVAVEKAAKSKPRKGKGKGAGAGEKGKAVKKVSASRYASDSESDGSRYESSGTEVKKWKGKKPVNKGRRGRISDSESDASEYESRETEMSLRKRKKPAKKGRRGRISDSESDASEYESRETGVSKRKRKKPAKKGRRGRISDSDSGSDSDVREYESSTGRKGRAQVNTKQKGRTAKGAKKSRRQLTDSEESEDGREVSAKKGSSSTTRKSKSASTNGNAYTNTNLFRNVNTNVNAYTNMGGKSVRWHSQQQSMLDSAGSESASEWEQPTLKNKKRQSSVQTKVAVSKTSKSRHRFGTDIGNASASESDGPMKRSMRALRMKSAREAEDMYGPGSAVGASAGEGDGGSEAELRPKSKTRRLSRGNRASQPRYRESPTPSPSPKPSRAISSRSGPKSKKKGRLPPTRGYREDSSDDADKAFLDDGDNSESASGSGSESDNGIDMYARLRQADMQQEVDDMGKVHVYIPRGLAQETAIKYSGYDLATAIRVSSAMANTSESNTKLSLASILNHMYEEQSVIEFMESCPAPSPSTMVACWQLAGSGDGGQRLMKCMKDPGSGNKYVDSRVS
ncbi:hypothetical protein, variant [Sphaeroforma arctica JP610]|uniref:Uncharacterized protein n=1 Tax=Sphaeroforma arctica JP610 TaxID=667725 RepID=A0A0L0G3X5_9EUKA|nr:hypothetical protein, variant [Sphaeroforma arctica JP610]KNC83745.1 hypothetical protein, variant [Sphaeroforma arctica JP610]|eukprot:XP_014157647.1 hypothetical protein, variant [Sphaeroforma arctica JP610]